MNLFIDLGSGLGGASEAFVQSTNWVVLRFDNAPEVQHVEETINLNYVSQIHEVIQRINDELYKQCYDKVVIWASPECNQWSDGYNSQKCKAKRQGIAFNPDLSQITAIRHIIEVTKPDSWIIENVKGAQEFINPILGQPHNVSNPVYLWGNHPIFTIPKVQSDKVSLGPSKMRYWLRSIIPFEISQALLLALENQTSLEDFI